MRGTIAAVRSIGQHGTPPRASRARSSPSRQLVKKEIDGGNLAVPGDDEIGSGVSRWVALEIDFRKRLHNNCANPPLPIGATPGGSAGLRRGSRVSVGVERAFGS